MTSTEAETLALQALGWLATREDLLAGFMAASGASPQHFGRSIEDPAFLVSILDFVTASDSVVTAFCDAVGLDYQLPIAARRYLSGRSETNWT